MGGGGVVKVGGWKACNRSLVLACSLVGYNLFYVIMGFTVNHENPHFHPKCLPVKIHRIFPKT